MSLDGCASSPFPFVLVQKLIALGVGIDGSANWMYVHTANSAGKLENRFDLALSSKDEGILNEHKSQEIIIS